MPEIAEVRTVRKVLKENIVGRTIKDINYRICTNLPQDVEKGFKSLKENLPMCEKALDFLKRYVKDFFWRYG